MNILFYKFSVWDVPAHSILLIWMRAHSTALCSRKWRWKLLSSIRCKTGAKFVKLQNLIGIFALEYYLVLYFVSWTLKQSWIEKKISSIFGAFNIHNWLLVNSPCVWILASTEEFSWCQSFFSSAQCVLSIFISRFLFIHS